MLTENTTSATVLYVLRTTRLPLRNDSLDIVVCVVVLQVPTTNYGSNVDKVVLAVEIPAGIIDGILCIFWFYAICADKWYKHPVALMVSALHAFGTFVFWGDEIFEGYMSWKTGQGWTWPNSGGPDAGIGFWWAFVGSNAVWVIVPALVIRDSLNELQKVLDVKNKRA